MKLLSTSPASRLAPAPPAGQTAAPGGGRRKSAGGGWLTAATLVAVAYGIFHYVYEPARAERAALDDELRTASTRQTDKQRRLEAMREKCAELERGDPETVAEVIRQELNKGAADEYFK